MQHDSDSGDVGEAPPERTLWDRIAGDGTHIGFWTLPVFVATALGGAVIAGAITSIYYAQQVDQLEEETAAARTAAEVAAQDIEDARQEALDAIEEQLDGVRDALEVANPVPDPAAAGVVALQVELTPSTPEAPPDDAGTATEPATPGTDGEVQGAPSDDPSATPGATQGGSAGPPAPVPGAPIREAVGFVVAVADGASFVATSYGAVADPDAADGVAPAVTVVSGAGTVRGVVHAWDEARDVAVVRVALTGIEPLRWRPATAPLASGDVVVLAAVTPGLVGVQLPGRIGATTPDGFVTDLPLDRVFDGAPLVDALGRVVGVQASTAAPFSGVPAQHLCVSLIQGCELLEEPHESDPDPTES